MPDLATTLEYMSKSGDLHRPRPLTRKEQADLDNIHSGDLTYHACVGCPFVREIEEKQSRCARVTYSADKIGLFTFLAYNHQKCWKARIRNAIKQMEARNV